MKMKRNKYARWKNNWENGRWKTYVIIWRKSKERESKRDDSLNYVHTRLLSRVRLFATPRTVACQAPLYMGFSRQEYWSGLPGPPSGDLPNPGIEPRSPVLKADSLPSELQGSPCFKIIYPKEERKKRETGQEKRRESDGWSSCNKMVVVVESGGWGHTFC